MAGYDYQRLKATDSESTTIVAVERSPDGEARAGHSLPPIVGSRSLCTKQVGALLNAYNFKARLMAVAGQSAFGSMCEFDWPTGTSPSLAKPYIVQAYIKPENESRLIATLSRDISQKPYDLQVKKLESAADAARRAKEEATAAKLRKLADDTGAVGDESGEDGQASNAEEEPWVPLPIGRQLNKQIYTTVKHLRQWLELSHGMSVTTFRVELCHTAKGELYVSTLLGWDETAQSALATLDSTQRLPHQRPPPAKDGWNSPAKGVGKSPQLRASLPCPEQVLQSLGPQVEDPTA